MEDRAIVVGEGMQEHYFVCTNKEPNIGAPASASVFLLGHPPPSSPSPVPRI